MSTIRPKAQCLPPQVTIRQIIDVYVNYMQTHPERRSQPYSEPLPQKNCGFGIYLGSSAWYEVQRTKGASLKRIAPTGHKQAL